jgi:hypothetical protein
MMPTPREEISKARLNRLRGLDNHERIDEELYHDYESEEAKKVNRQRIGQFQQAESQENWIQEVV